MPLWLNTLTAVSGKRVCLSPGLLAIFERATLRPKAGLRNKRVKPVRAILRADGAPRAGSHFTGGLAPFGHLRKPATGKSARPELRRNGLCGAD